MKRCSWLVFMLIMYVHVCKMCTLECIFILYLHVHEWLAKIHMHSKPGFARMCLHTKFDT